MRRATGCLVVFALAFAAPAQAGPAARQELAALYAARRAGMGRAPFDVPMQVEASLGDERVSGDVYAVLDHEFAQLSRELAKPAVWCDVVTLHFNVKSCQARETRADAPVAFLSIAMARKHYVPPSARTPLAYRLDLSGSDESAVMASLQAEKGPLGVRDLRIEVGAMGLPDGRSFVHLHYAYTEQWTTRMAMRTYLATLGRNKIGFTVTGHTDAGDPIYVGGAAGALERNAMRYHLAIQAYFDTLAVDEDARFESRIARWYDLTDRFRDQLYEMPRESYLELKRREHRDMMLQATARLDKRRR